MAILEARKLVKRYGGLVAVNGVSLAVEPRTVTALIGPNGAGKTTFFKMLAGEIKPTEGEVIFKGHAIAGLGMTRIAQLGLCKSFQITQVFPKLTVLENVTVPVLAAKRGAFRPDIFRSVARVPDIDGCVERALAAVDLGDRREMRAEDLSYGEKRRLELALALATEPEVLLLDEPAAGMSPSETHALVELIGRLRTTVTVVIVEHDMDVVFGLADRIVVLQDGNIIAAGDATEIRGNQRVREAYLGGVA